MLPLLLVVVIGVAVAIAVLAYRNRPEHSIQSGISSFRREMSALAPPAGEPDPHPSADQPAEDPPGPGPGRPEDGPAAQQPAGPDEP